MAQTGGEGEREENIRTLGRKTQVGVVRASKAGVIRVPCIERAAASMIWGKAADCSRRLWKNGSCNNFLEWIYSVPLV